MMMMDDDGESWNADPPATDLLSLFLFLSLDCGSSSFIVLIQLNVPTTFGLLRTGHRVISLNLSQQTSL